MHDRFPSRPTRLAILAALLALALWPALGDAATPNSAAAATSKWGWVTVRQARNSYIPAAKDRGSSAGGTNEVFYRGVGVYIVLLRGIADNGGTVLVTPLGTAANRCTAAFWAASGADEVVGVDCYGPNDQAADSRFVVSFLAVSGTGGRLAYAWVDDPASSTSTPDLDYQYASRGDRVLASRTVGEHVAVLPHLGTAKGHVQVTAFDIRGGGSAECLQRPGLASRPVARWAAAGHGRDHLVLGQDRDARGRPTLRDPLHAERGPQGRRWHPRVLPSREPRQQRLIRAERRLPLLDSGRNADRPSKQPRRIQRQAPGHAKGRHRTGDGVRRPSPALRGHLDPDHGNAAEGRASAALTSPAAWPTRSSRSRTLDSDRPW